MRKIPFVKKLLTSKATFPVALVFSIALWWLFPHHLYCAIGYPIALLLMWFMNQRFVILQGKITSFLGIFALGIASTPLLHQTPDGLYILLSWMVCQSVLFFGYEHHDRVQILHVCGLFIGGLAIWNPMVLYLLPLIWLNAKHCRVLTAKSWVSSIIGTMVPTLFWWAWLSTTKESAVISAHFSQIATWSWPTEELPFVQLATGALLIIMLLMAIISLALSTQGVRRQTVHYLYSVTEAGALGLFLACTSTQNWHVFLPLAVWGTTWGATRFLRRGNTWMHAILFFLITLTMIGIGTLHYLEI